MTEVLWNYEAFQNAARFRFFACFWTDSTSLCRTHGITAVLRAWGILDSRKVLLSLALGNKESGEAWLEFLRVMSDI